MGYLLLLAIGATLGWFASNLRLNGGTSEVVASVGMGMAGAAIGGSLLGTNLLIHGITSDAILGAAIAAALLLVGFHFITHAAVR